MNKLDYVWGYDEQVAQFTAQLIPSCRERGFSRASRAMGIVEIDPETKDANLIAGVVYHNWEPDAGIIEMSVAALPGKQWLTRETIMRMYLFPFIQCGCQMTIARVDAANERLLRQMASLNYSFIRVPRMLGRDRDGVLCLLTDDQWANSKFVKRMRQQQAEQLNEAA